MSILKVFILSAYESSYLYASVCVRYISCKCEYVCGLANWEGFGLTNRPFT